MVEIHELHNTALSKFSPTLKILFNLPSKFNDRFESEWNIIRHYVISNFVQFSSVEIISPSLLIIPASLSQWMFCHCFKLSKPYYMCIIVVIQYSHCRWLQIYDLCLIFTMSNSFAVDKFS